jgi:hypothetical protein
MQPRPDPAAHGAGRRLPRWLRTTLLVVAVLAAAAVAARLAAPSYIRRAVNHRLEAIPGYGGSVARIRLHLWRGAYEIDGMRIVKKSGKVADPFFSARVIDFSIAWREIIRGRLVSDILVTDGHIDFERGPTEESTQLAADRRWQDVIKDLFPIDITHLEIDGGVVEFVDTTHSPKVDVAVHDIKVLASGLQNRPDKTGEEFPASIDLSGITIGGGRLQLYAKLEPLADQAHFQFAVELRKVALPALNDFMKAYADVEVSRGQFEVFGQMAMQKGHYEGYVKPFLRDVDFKTADKNGKNLGEEIWKDLVAGLSKLFKNPKTNQLATRIPFSGDATNMDVKTLRSIVNGLHHAFVKALPQAFEGTTHPDTPKSTLPPVASPAVGTNPAAGSK